jgi:ABC-type nickel/cobalt efflux system permease component RcnA
MWRGLTEKRNKRDPLTAPLPQIPEGIVWSPSRRTADPMETLIAIQGWLYGGMASNLGKVGDNPTAFAAAMAGAVLFGILHALMPGHGKAVLASHHATQPGKIWEGAMNGAVLASTHVGLAVVLVLAGFVVVSKAFALGGRTPQFEIASGVLITGIGSFLLWRSVREHDHFEPRNGTALAFATGLIPCPLTTFVMSYALARGMVGAGLVITAAMAAGMIVTIGGVAVLAALARTRVKHFFNRSEKWRRSLGNGLEIFGAIAVLALGLLTIARSQI